MRKGVVLQAYSRSGRVQKGGGGTVQVARLVQERIRYGAIPVSSGPITTYRRKETLPNKKGIAVDSFKR